MTDTKDIAALREKYELSLKDLTERLMECNRLNYCMDEITAFAAFSSTLIDQLEAERQRADDAFILIGYAEDGKGFVYEPRHQDRISNPIAIYRRKES
ncbi:hypothetical protein [Rahnella bonaserana]|uniref:hypothetical protein n=1 Tax=Rahnella bonaserana TaxID=2816248 RepID=UPI00320B027C